MSRWAYVLWIWFLLVLGFCVCLRIEGCINVR